MKIIVSSLWIITIVASLSSKLAQVEAKLEELKNLLFDLERELHKDEFEVRHWLRLIDGDMRKIYNEMVNAEWDFETDMNNITSAHKVEIAIKLSEYSKSIAMAARRKKKSMSFFLTKETKRTLRLLSQFADPKDKTMLEQLERTKSTLQNIYATATLKKDGKTYNMEPELTKLMMDERDPDVLKWAWKGWRDVTGKNMKSLYTDLIKLLNKGADDNGYSDYGEVWRSEQFDDTKDLIEICEKAWNDISPLYKKLHAYVRMRLRNYYAEKFPNYNFPKDGTIPAHLLGNMWGQEWQDIYTIVKPYPDVHETDVTEEMKKQKWDVKKLFTMAEEFYTSLGLDRMTDTFWEKSMLERPEGKDVQCHASASDFYTDEDDKTKDDFRIKMCTEVNAEYFETIHHEMGHIQYFMEYRNQPTVFRTGANSAFHEAIGDTISLSVQTHKHLKTVGLIPEDQTGSDAEEKKIDMNILMKQALYKVAFLPFGYLIDLWRFKVFDGTISEDNYNKEWWKLRLKYQGLSSPVTRTDEDFDPGAKFHIPSNSPYICYFISFIAQFQFYQSLCKESGHTGPLHTCDYYQSKDAGMKLQSFLRLGHSIPWRDAMEVLTGSTEIETGAITEYFQPLSDWLDSQIKNEELGWDGAKINFE